MAVTFVVPLAFAIATIVIPAFVIVTAVIPTIISTFILAIFPTLISAIILAIFPTIILVITMPFLIIRNILAFVPVVMDKEDPLAAGVVLATVLVPMFGMARRNAQINRRTVHRYPTLNDDRTTIDHPGLRKVAYVNVTIETGLADADRNANVASEYRGGNRGSGYRYGNQKTFHLGSPLVGILRKTIIPVSKKKRTLLLE